MAAEVRIWLLGGFRVGLDSRTAPDEAWRRNKAKAVVKLLALTPSHRLHREHLARIAPAAAVRPLLVAAGSAYERLGATPDHQAVKSRLLALA